MRSAAIVYQDLILREVCLSNANVQGSLDFKILNAFESFGRRF